MSNILDIFNNDLFSTTSLTDSIDVVPNMYGRLNELGLFGFRGVNTTSVVVEFRDGVLNLLPTAPRGAPGSLGTSAKRRALSFLIPHIPHEDVVKADDVQGVRQFGSASALETVAGVVNRKLVDMARKHYITWEYQRVGAISGKVMDADGTLLHDLFQSFGVEEKVVNFDFDNVEDVEKPIYEVLRYLEDNLLGDVMNQAICLCSQQFFDAFMQHKSVKEAYKNYPSLQEPLRTDTRRRFIHKGMIFEEYRGNAAYLDPNGTLVRRQFIRDNEARIIPLGTQSTFAHYGGPADFLETANTIGRPIYAKSVIDPMGRVVNLHSQSNPLFLCTRPNLLVRAVMSAA